MKQLRKVEDAIDDWHEFNICRPQELHNSGNSQEQRHHNRIGFADATKEPFQLFTALNRASQLKIRLQAIQGEKKDNAPKTFLKPQFCHIKTSPGAKPKPISISRVTNQGRAELIKSTTERDSTYSQLLKL